MATSQAAKNAAKRRTKYHGKYIGPEKYKGRVQKGDKKHKGKYYGKEKYKGRNPDYKAPAPKPAAKPKPAPNQGPTAPARPIVSPDGTILDPSQWEADMARLKIREEDRDQWMGLNEQEAKAVTDEKSFINQATQKSKTDIAGFNVARRAARMNYNTEGAGINNRMAFRGMGRSSAAARANSESLGNYSAEDTGLMNSIGKSTTGLAEAIAQAKSTTAATRAQILARRTVLANRAAASGNYTK